MTYEGIGFNSEWAASQTLEAFAEHEAHHGLKPAQYKEVHKLCKLENKSQNANDQVSNEKPNPESAGV